MSSPAYPSNTSHQHSSSSQSQSYSAEPQLQLAMDSLSIDPHAVANPDNDHDVDNHDNDQDVDADGGQPEYTIPLQYKIVDLPVITMPTMNTLKVMNCKIYRKPIHAEINAVHGQTQWKRKCMGRIKFVQMHPNKPQPDQCPQNINTNSIQIVVAAYQYNSCHLRLQQKPKILHNSNSNSNPNTELYKLLKSQQYQNNWVYKNQQNQYISIAFISESQCQQFRQMWQYSRITNTNNNHIQQKEEGKQQKQQEQKQKQGQQKKLSIEKKDQNKSIDFGSLQ